MPIDGEKISVEFSGGLSNIAEQNLKNVTINKNGNLVKVDNMEFDIITIKESWEWSIKEGFSDEQLGVAKKIIPDLIACCESTIEAIKRIYKLNSILNVKEVAKIELLKWDGHDDSSLENTIVSEFICEYFDEYLKNNADIADKTYKIIEIIKGEENG